jgi:hypothetical protein
LQKSRVVYLSAEGLLFSTSLEQLLSQFGNALLS